MRLRSSRAPDLSPYSERAAECWARALLRSTYAPGRPPRAACDSGGAPVEGAASVRLDCERTVGVGPVASGRCHARLCTWAPAPQGFNVAEVVSSNTEIPSRAAMITCPWALIADRRHVVATKLAAVGAGLGPIAHIGSRQRFRSTACATRRDQDREHDPAAAPVGATPDAVGRSAQRPAPCAESQVVSDSVVAESLTA